MSPPDFENLLFTFHQDGDPVLSLQDTPCDTLALCSVFFHETIGQVRARDDAGDLQGEMKLLDSWVWGTGGGWEAETGGGWFLGQGLYWVLGERKGEVSSQAWPG